MIQRFFKTLTCLIAFSVAVLIYSEAAIGGRAFANGLDIRAEGSSRPGQAHQLTSPTRSWSTISIRPCGNR